MSALDAARPASTTSSSMTSAGVAITPRDAFALGAAGAEDLDVHDVVLLFRLWV